MWENTHENKREGIRWQHWAWIRNCFWWQTLTQISTTKRGISFLNVIITTRKCMSGKIIRMLTHGCEQDMWAWLLLLHKNFQIWFPLQLGQINFLHNQQWSLSKDDTRTWEPIATCYKHKQKNMVGNAFVLKCWRGSLKDLKSKGSRLQSLAPRKKIKFSS